jgi:Flp pilus assembly protein TadD
MKPISACIRRPRARLARPCARSLLAPALLLAALCGGCGGAAASAEAPTQQTPSGAESFQQGKAALLRGDHTRAEQYLKIALDQGYQTDETVLLLVHACLSGSRFRAALNYAEPHLLSHPEDKALRYLVATVHLGLGHQDEAMRDLNLLSEQAPEYADTYFLRGVARWQQRDVSAHLDFEHYLALAPAGRHAPEANSLLSDIRLTRKDPSALQWAEVSREAPERAEGEDEDQTEDQDASAPETGDLP